MVFPLYTPSVLATVDDVLATVDDVHVITEIGCILNSRIHGYMKMVHLTQKDT